MNTSDSQTMVIQVPPFCLNRQAAIAFSSFKPAFFDEHVRPRLRELRAGTSVLYMREDIEGVIRTMFSPLDALDAGPASELRAGPARQTTASKKVWEKRQPASIKPQTADGKSTSASMENDFMSALKALKTRKAG